MNLSDDLKWLRSHVLLVILTAALVYGAVYYVEHIISNHDTANDQKWQQILATQALNTKSLQQTLASQQAAAKSQNDAAFAAIAQLSKSIQARDLATQTQIQKDSSLSALEVSQRLSQQTGAQPNEITTQAENIIFDLPLARVVTQKLDLLPSLQSDLSDTQKELSSQKVVTTNLQGTTETQQSLIASLNLQLTDASKACQVQITAIKATALKSKLRWFAAGAIFGAFAKRIFVGTF